MNVIQDDQVSRPPVRKQSLILSLARRTIMFFIVAFAIGWVLHQASHRLHDDNKPAGFALGVIHGALMPLAMPNLLVGSDVSIYAPVNTGRTYKLGYTVGVNGCGVLFFGFFFRRVNQWRNRKAQTQVG